MTEVRLDTVHLRSEQKLPDDYSDSKGKWRWVLDKGLPLFGIKRKSK